MQNATTEMLLRRARRTTGSEAARLARAVVERDPDCVDAWFILAERGVDTLEEARDAYENLLRAFERQLAPESVEELGEDLAEHVDGIVYLKALEGLARIHWYHHEDREAISRLDEVLRLAPLDPWRSRYHLFNYLLAAGELERLGALLRRYEEPLSANWSYSRALHAFRSQGDTPEARRLLRLARKCNPFVVDLLLGRRPIPEQLAISPQYRSRDDAASYAAFAVEVWEEVPGSLEWLEEVTGVFRKAVAT